VLRGTNASVLRFLFKDKFVARLQVASREAWQYRRLHRAFAMVQDYPL
jgi:hypothetical protein